MHQNILKNRLLDLISRFPDGVSSEELLLGIDPSISRRTLQRLLSVLVKEKRLQAVGNARARRYLLNPLSGEKKNTEPLISLSQQGAAIQLFVNQPMQKRSPIGYNREFLKSYLPNHTFYLPEELRKKLKQQGRGGDSDAPTGTYAKKIFHRLLIDLSWNSSRLEGNTYSLLETERLLDSGTGAAGKTLKETQMILNHKSAIEFLIHSALQIGINRFTVTNIHAFLSDNLLSDPALCGRLRLYPVGIERSVYRPLEIPQVIEECFTLLIEKVTAIRDPFEQAFFLMVHLPYLQPFEDVNKRTSRLAANIPLLQNNFSPLSFIDVPQDIYISGLLGVYELNRVELLRDLFEWAYARSCTLYSVTQKTLGEPDPFRIQYRDAICHVVEMIVRNQLEKGPAIEIIHTWAREKVKQQDRAKFIEVAERELLNLHEGNIARYHLSLADYELWKNSWKSIKG